MSGRVPTEVARELALEAIERCGSLAAAAREAGLPDRRLSGIIHYEFANVGHDTYERVVLAARGPGGCLHDRTLRRWLWSSDTSDVA